MSWPKLATPKTRRKRAEVMAVMYIIVKLIQIASIDKLKNNSSMFTGNTMSPRLDMDLPHNDHTHMNSLGWRLFATCVLNGQL